MTYQATVYTLMISCPSDACKEQQEVKKQIIGWNEVYSEKDSRVLLPAFYKTHVPPMLASAEDPRAQAAINKHMIPAAQFSEFDLKSGNNFHMWGRKCRCSGSFPGSIAQKLCGSQIALSLV